jgi:uncharacterized protein (DUF1501 family)
VTFPQVQQTGRLVFVLLRGGLDGLFAVAPRGDPAYRSLRGSLAFEDGDLWPLDGLFGLSPGLAPLREAWDRWGQLAGRRGQTVREARITEPPELAFCLDRRLRSRRSFQIGRHWRQAPLRRRDLRPTLDTRAVLKAAIAGTFDLTAAQADRVFRGSGAVRGPYQLMA